MLKILSKQALSKKSWSRKTSNLKEDDIVSKPASSFENILFHLNALKKSQEIFDQFMEVVEEDVKKKTIVLKSHRLNDPLTANQKTYVSVQSFILKYYLNRIKSFQRASDSSIGNICGEYCKDNRDDRKVSDQICSDLIVCHNECFE